MKKRHRVEPPRSRCGPVEHRPLVWNSLLSRTAKRPPKTPEGVRIYAIGDVHGRADLLAQVFATIDADVAAYPARWAIQVLLGDYIDRGPQSRETPSMNADEQERRELAAELDHALPESHRRFLTGLPPSFACGDYFFVHAGVRPGSPLADQRHTPVTEPDIRPHRININTGAYATGRLTCLVLEGEDMSFL